MTFLGPSPPTSPTRIVSLVPSVTETLADLGLDDEVAGLTRFCVHPAGWKRAKTIVGGTKHVNVERVLSLGPDLVVANREENVRDQVEALAETVSVALFDVATVEEAIQMIRDLGALCGRSPMAEAISNEIENSFPSRTPTIRATYLIWRDPWMTVGGDTFISDVMLRSGFINVSANGMRYPEITLESLLNSDTEIVLLSSEPFPFKEEHRNEVESEARAPAILVDGQAFSWHGSRMRRAPEALDETWRQATNLVATGE